MIRPALSEIEPYRPGLTVAEVKAKALGLERVIKLGSNEGTFGPTPRALEAAARAARAANRYPDPWCTQLREAIAERYDLDPDQVVPGNGADELIRLLCQATVEAGRSCVFPWPGFPTHAQGARAAGGHAVAARMNPGLLDLEAVLDAVDESTALVCIANPNNPTGAYVGQAELEAFLDRLPGDVICLLDEAYFEYVDAGDRADGTALVAQGRSGVCTVRTFSKAYGLAGFRVGYALAAPGVADALNRVRTTFNVNQPGQAAAEVALEETAELEARVAVVRARRARLSEILGTAGLRAFPSQGNFVYAEVLGADGRGDPWAATRLADAALTRGIIVRPMGGFGAEEAIRVTVGTDQELDALSRVLDEIAATARS